MQQVPVRVAGHSSVQYVSTLVDRRFGSGCAFTSGPASWPVACSRLGECGGSSSEVADHSGVHDDGLGMPARCEYSLSSIILIRVIELVSQQVLMVASFRLSSSHTRYGWNHQDIFSLKASSPRL